MRWPFIAFAAATVLNLIGWFTLGPERATLTTVAEWGQLVALLATLASSLFCFTTGRKTVAMLNLLLFVAYGVVTVLTVLYNAMLANFAEQDHFADALFVPAGLDAGFPEGYRGVDEPETGQTDPFGAALVASLAPDAGDDATVRAEVPALARLWKERPELVRRYLASSAAWRVFEQRGRSFATRRWRVGQLWRPTLHGYYTQSDLASGAPAFQSRVTLGLSGAAWARGGRGTTSLPGGTEQALRLEPGNGQLQSQLVITGDGPVVEVFEQSAAPARVLTRTALALLEQEFSALAAAPDWAAAQALLPEGSLARGAPSLTLREVMGAGIYALEGWVNPAEAGEVWLRAFEVTRGAELSAERVREATHERIGWSSDPDVLFLANTQFTLYEGNPGQPYAARLELWFRADADGKERKLLERVFRVEGWAR